MIEILDKKTVEHSNGMVHHSFIYKDGHNEKRIIALIERPFKEGKQASLIKSHYDYLKKRWRTDSVRFFYDQVFYSRASITFDEIYNDAIKIGRLEYIACLEDMMIDKEFLSEINNLPVNLVEYRSTCKFYTQKGRKPYPLGLKN